MSLVVVVGGRRQLGVLVSRCRWFRGNASSSSSSSIVDLNDAELPRLRDPIHLESLVMEIEGRSVTTAKDVTKWIHPLMLATCALETNEGAHLTERLLAKCLQHVQYDDNDNNNNWFLPHPNAEMYNLAMTAWTRAGASPQRVERLLQLMVEEHKREKQLSKQQEQKPMSPKPDMIHYSSVLHAWAKAGAPIPAQELLTQLEYRSGIQDWLNNDDNDNDNNKRYERHLTPDRACYHAVMMAWARSGNKKKQATDEIRSLIARLQRLHDTTGHHHYEPDIRCDNLLMRAMTNRHDAERLLRETKHQPNIHTYNTLLRLQPPKRAQLILDALLGNNNDDDVDLPIAKNVWPNVVTFNTVVRAWAKVGNGIKAEEVLLRMEQPDVITYRSVLEAWSKHPHDERIGRARSLLHRMPYKDDRACFHFVLAACARPTKLRREAFFTAVDAFNRMAHPNAKTYKHMLRVLAIHLPQHKDLTRIIMEQYRNYRHYADK